MNAFARLLRVAGLLTLESAAVLSLHRLGERPQFAIPHDHLDSWLRTTAPDNALVAVLRVAALVGSLWLLATTVAYVVACLCRVPGAVRVTGALTLPFVRRVVDAGLAASIAAGSLLGAATITANPAGARSASPPVTSAPASGTTPGASTPTGVRDGHAGDLASLPAAPLPHSPHDDSPHHDSSRGDSSRGDSSRDRPPVTGPGVDVPLGAVPAGALPTGALPTGTASNGPDLPASITVQAGDSLWELAATHLAQTTGRARDDVDDAEITPHWIALCDANRAHLRSGDPNLIYPGEVVTFPPAR